MYIKNFTVGYQLVLVLSDHNRVHNRDTKKNYFQKSMINTNVSLKN
jgi:hypothetical protein